MQSNTHVLPITWQQPGLLPALMISILVIGTIGCGHYGNAYNKHHHGQTQTSGAAGHSAEYQVAVDSNASSLTVGALQVNRLKGWRFVAGDTTNNPSLKARIHGPTSSDIRPLVIEIDQRTLNADAQTSTNEAILKQFQAEVLTQFAHATITSPAVAATLSGLPALKTIFTVNEVTSTGDDNGAPATTVVVYIIHHQEHVWIVRGKSDAIQDQDTIIRAIHDTLRNDSSAP